MQIVINIVLIVAVFALWVKNSYVQDELEDLKDELGV